MNQNGDQWINNRLGKSREHTYRFAVNIQLIELAFALLDQYYYEHNHFNDHKADRVFRLQMIETANKFLNRTDLSQRVSMDIHYEVVQSAINTVLMNINQYECFFSDCGLTRLVIYIFIKVRSKKKKGICYCCKLFKGFLIIRKP